MTDDDAIETVQCPSCERYIPYGCGMETCGCCQERCCDDCLVTNEKIDRRECAACREGEALYRDTVGAIDFSRRGQ